MRIFSRSLILAPLMIFLSCSASDYETERKDNIGGRGVDYSSAYPVNKSGLSTRVGSSYRENSHRHSAEQDRSRFSAGLRWEWN